MNGTIAGNVLRTPWKASALLASVLLLLGFIGVHGGLPSGIKYVVEIVLLVPMVLMVALHPVVRDVFGRMPRAQRNFAVAFIGAFWLGNIVKQHHLLFPLGSWGMFGRAVTTLPAQSRYYGVYADGSEVPLMRGGELSEALVCALDGALWHAAEPYFEAKDAAARNATRGAAVAALESLARMHEQDQGLATGTLAGVRLERCEIAVTGDYRTSCTQVIDTTRMP